MKAGEKIKVLIHSYAEHGPMGCTTGWVAPGRETVPDPEKAQCVIGTSTVSIFNEEMFGNMNEAQVLTKRWVEYYNTMRPHSSFGGRPPAPQMLIPLTA